jgi:nucleotide-binding universal stress UspA family protein
MALKDLLVHVDQSERTSGRLRLAADLARRHGSRLTAIYVREPNPADRHLQSVAELGLGSAAAIGRVNQQIKKSIDEAADGLRAELDQLKREFGLEVEWRCVD